MESKQKRVTLDDPELTSRLRYDRRSSAYERRPVGQYSHLISDVKPPSRSRLAKQPKHKSEPSTTAEKTAEKDSSAQSAASNSSRLERLVAPFRPSNIGRKQAALYAMAVLLFIAGGYVSFNGWQTNHQVAAQAEHLQKQVNHNSHNGRNKSDSPSTKPVSHYSMADYHVAADLARYIRIPKINVYARVLQTGVTSDGALGVPPNIYDTAWYTGSAKPGAPGATLIDGHLDGYNAAGVFWNLHELVKGDTITIERGDGKIITYKVVKKTAYDVNHTDMNSAMLPVVQGKPGLNLITCDGDYVAGSKNGYNKRLIVYATQV